MGSKKSKQRKTDLPTPAARQQELATGGACESSEDWQVSDEDQEWFDLLLAIEEGRAPDNLVLAKHLRNSKYVVEQPVREYLADHLEDKIKRKRGRPKDETVERVLRDFRIKALYASILPEMRKLPRAKRRCTPTKAALRETVKRLAAENKKHMSIGAVKRIVQGARTVGK